MEKYLIPNYFKKFKCKCGDCRNTCCVGWTVTMSVNEYFKIKFFLSLQKEQNRKHYSNSL